MTTIMDVVRGVVLVVLRQKFVVLTTDPYMHARARSHNNIF